MEKQLHSGQNVSDQAEKCIHCGRPLNSAVHNTNDTLVLYGYTGCFLVKPKLKINLNGEYIGDIAHKAKAKEIPISGPTTVEIKCGIRSMAVVRLFSGKYYEIYTEFDRITGSIRSC